MQLGMVALETSRIALNKARNDDLKQFANFEVQEQTTLSEILRSMMDPSATAATGSSAGQAAMPNVQMDASARDMIRLGVLLDLGAIVVVFVILRLLCPLLGWS